MQVSSPTLKGEARDMSALIQALELIESQFAEGLATNAVWCDECKQTSFNGSSSPLFHTFLVRESLLLLIIRAQAYKWTKRRGFGRLSAEMYLQNLISNGEEVWFQLELSEI